MLRVNLTAFFFENVLLNISRFLHGPLSYQSLQSQEIKISGIKIFLNVLLKKNAVKLEPICVNKPVKDVHRNIKIYDNEIGE